MVNAIYDYDRRILRLHERIKEASWLSEDEKRSFLDFDQAMAVVEGLTKPRRSKVLCDLMTVRRIYFDKPLADATVDDLKGCLQKLGDKDYSPWTLSDFKSIIKKYFKWLAYGDDFAHVKEYPKIVSWINVNIKIAQARRVLASDILTEDEAHRLIAAADKPRDRAFISLLYELGARIGEVGNMLIKDVTRDKYSYLVDITGKTGHRTPRIVMSDPYLTEWIDHHPLNDDPNAPMWVVRTNNGHYKKMMYPALRALVKRLRSRAGIKKRIYPHLFRHSRVTHLLLKRQLNEAQAKVYFGWTPNSNMLSHYAHLVSKDVNDIILQIHGIKAKREDEPKLEKTCSRCKRINAPEARFCIHCSSILDAKGAFGDEAKRKETNNLMASVLDDPDVKKLILEKLRQLDVQTLKQML